MAASKIYRAGTGQPFFAPIAAATGGDNTLVAAVTNKQIRVISLAVQTGITNLYFTSGPGGTVIFGGSANKMTFAAGAMFVLPEASELGWFETAAGAALVMNSSAAVSTSGGLVYVLIG